jgi:hypothetical protein
MYSDIVEYGMPGLEFSPADSIASTIDRVAKAMFESMKNKADIVVRADRENNEAVLFYNYTNIDDENPLDWFNYNISIDEVFNELIKTLPESYGDEAKDEISKIISSIESSLVKLKSFRDGL